MTDDEYQNNEAFCPLPWTGIYVEPNGRVDTCCISKNGLGNINETSVADMVSSFKNIQIKQDMLAGNKVDGCRICYPVDKSIDYNKIGQYPRHRHLKTHDTYVPDKNFYDDPKKFNLKYADLRFRNTCNYACVYCGEALSSTWAAEKKIFPRIDNDGIENLVNYFCENAGEVSEVCLAGGEPLMIKENERVVAALLEKNPDCFVMVNTNLSQIRNNKIFELLVQMPNVMWVTSVEATHDRYNYIRWPGQWDEFASNLQMLKDTVPAGHRRTFNMVYNALNMINIFDCVDYLVENGYASTYDFCTLVYVNGGYNPTVLDPRSTPASYLEQSNERIRYEIQKHTQLGNLEYAGSLQYLLDINQAKLEKQPKWFVNHLATDLFGMLKQFDQQRKIDSVATFPEIYAYKKP